MKAERLDQIALALSGGGVRAMAFHMGILNYLAQTDALKQVVRISTVSGGSLLIGKMLELNHYAWPTADQYQSSIYPALRQLLSNNSLNSASIKQMAWPNNWPHLLTRAHLMSRALQKSWGICARLNDVPSLPEWILNGSNAESGNPFTMQAGRIGNETTGYAEPGDFDLADAMAASAAFPFSYGPMPIDCGQFKWQHNAHRYRKLHVYDGGLVDNQALEPYFDPGTGQIRMNHLFIIACDADAPLIPQFNYSAVNPMRLKRLAGITVEQTRSLRVRAFDHYLKSHTPAGHYLSISADTDTGQHWTDQGHPAQYRTSLWKINKADFDAIAGHGFELARRTDSVSRLLPRT